GLSGTWVGGMGGGTGFRIASGGSFSTLVTFADAGLGYDPLTGLVLGSDGDLYGTTDVGGAGNYGTIFRVDTAGTALTTVHDFLRDEGASPNGVVQAQDGHLYGTTSDGGARDLGTIFRADPVTGTLTTIHSLLHDEGSAF